MLIVSLWSPKLIDWLKLGRARAKNRTLNGYECARSCKFEAVVQKSTLFGLVFDSKSFYTITKKYDEDSI